METITMPIEAKDGAAPAKNGAPAAPAPADEIFIRKLDHPYFELRTPDAQANSYLEGNAHKMITADQEKLHRFLAPARIVIDTSATPRKRSVHYKLDAELYKNVRRMDALPPSELAGFEAAAKDFYDKAAPDRKDVHPYETFLRLNFRLPDPEREPDAYLVYGEDYERRLLILWGCEKEKDSALALSPHPVIRSRRGGETVLDKLRRKVIGWEQMQKDALLLLAKTREPLFRFIGQPVKDERGALKGVKIGEVALSANSLRPLRYLLPPEMKLFYKACQDFYARAATAESPYEKELRSSFQLPDPDKNPDAFRVHGPINNPRLIIVFDGGVKRDESLWLTPVPEQNIPPMPPVTPEQELLGQKPVPSLTLTDKMQRRTVPFAKIFTIAGAIVATPILAAVLIWLSLDKTPPHPLKQIVAGPADRSILVRFNEPIDPSSLPHGSAAIPKSFVLLEANGLPVNITSIALNKSGEYKGREIQIEATAPFKDAGAYRLSVNGLADLALLHNQMRKPVEVDFVYNDDKPPTLVGKPSGDGETLSHLVLTFNKTLDPASVMEPANYSIDGSIFKVNSATLDDDKKSVILNVSPEMPLKSEHTLTLKGIKDASHLGNKINPDPTTVSFVFVDTLPPKLRKVFPDDQNQVMLEFNEKLNAATITNLANYSLMTHKNGEKLAIYNAQLVDPKKIALTTAPLFKDIEYDLTATKIGDVAEPCNIMSTVERRTFTLPPELENHSLPAIDSITHTPDRTKIIVNFGITNRLRPDIDLARQSFSLKMLEEGEQKDFSSLISTVSDEALKDYPPGLERLSLTLSGPLEKGATYIVSAKGLQDIWGNTNSDSDKALKVKGFIKPLSLGRCWFADNSRRIIRLDLSWPVDSVSLNPANWTVPGRNVLEVQRGPNNYMVLLKLDSSISSDQFTILCSSLRMEDSSVEQNNLRFNSDQPMSAR